MSAAPQLLAGAHRMALTRPLLMGIVNASPESFSDGDRVGDTAAQFARAAQLVAEGADVIDVGGESGVTGEAVLDPQAEIARVVPLIERITGELGAVVSVDTFKPQVAEAAVAAGASIINDVSGLRDPRLAEIAARTGAALVLMHTRTPPKVKLLDAAAYDDVAADVEAFLAERIAQALAAGVDRQQLLLDPGPDFAKTPRQTVEALRGIPALRARFGRPLLLALSRKDFIGALCGRAPRDRAAGTLAAIAELARPGDLLRVHDVAQTADLLRVRAALRGELEVDPALRLDPALRRQHRSGSGAR